MSAHDLHAGHGDHHDHDDLHVTMGDYVKGFILAVILTVIPFYLVMSGAIEDRATGLVVLGAFAIVQVVVLPAHERQDPGWLDHAIHRLHRGLPGHRRGRYAVGDVPDERPHDADARERSGSQPARRGGNGCACGASACRKRSGCIGSC